MHISEKVKNDFPGLKITASQISDVLVRPTPKEFNEFIREKTQEIIKKWSSESLRQDPIIKAYRDFFWKLNIDPTKIRPAAEALIRRIINKKMLPQINSVVDAYNIASVETKITLGAYDINKIKGEITIRYAHPFEKFMGIGGKEIELTGSEIVVADEEGVFAIYPYRDGERTKVTTSTKNILLAAYGVGSITASELENALRKAARYILDTAGGKVVDFILIE